MKKYKRQADMVLGGIFLLLILICFLVNLIVPDKAESAMENRTLTQRPHFSVRDISDGTFMEQTESHLSDQFVGRDGFRGLYSTVRQLGGSRESGDVYRGRKGQLLEAITVPDEQLLATTMDSIRAFTERHPDITSTMILVPDAAEILKKDLPMLAPHTDQHALFDGVKGALPPSVGWVDAGSALNGHTDEKLYYKTDHHWTTTGARYVYEASCEALGITQPGSFTPYSVTNDFHGSLIAASGFDKRLEEDIEVMIPDTAEQVLVSYVDEQKITTSLYDTSKLEERDQYQVFLGGNTSLLDIQTTTGSNRRLLIFKDSFANCFIPFLTGQFGEIVVVDPRYYSGGADALVKDYRITDVLFLYSGNIFFNDNSLSGVLNSNPMPAESVTVNTDGENSDADDEGYNEDDSVDDESYDEEYDDESYDEEYDDEYDEGYDDSYDEEYDESYDEEYN